MSSVVASGIDCGIDCAGFYPSFTDLTLTATPKPGSTFTGWRGACSDASGDTCELTTLEDGNATASFGLVKSPRLRISRLRPKKPSVKRGRTLRLKVTAKNAGNEVAENTKICLSTNNPVKPLGRKCVALGRLGPGKSRMRSFKIKATRKARKGARYRVRFILTANGSRPMKSVIKVKAR